MEACSIEHVPGAESVVRETFAALDAHDLDRFRALLHPDAEDRFLAVGTFAGRDAIVAFFKEMFAADTPPCGGRGCRDGRMDEARDVQRRFVPGHSRNR